MHEQSYPLSVMHQDVPSKSWCAIYGRDLGQNPIEIGYIDPDSVLFLGNDPYDVQRLHAYDVQFFEKMAKCLRFAKP